MVSLGITAASSLLVAAAFLVQPVPAPVELGFLALLAAPGLCGLAIGAAAMASNRYHGKRDLPASCSSNPFFDACQSDATNGGEGIVQINKDNSLVADGLSPSCIAQINEYNSLPDIERLNAEYGTVTVLNGTVMRLSDLSESVMSYLNSLKETDE
jgi:hypothetical protein